MFGIQHSTKGLQGKPTTVAGVEFIGVESEVVVVDMVVV